ncbi:hypothetical protein JG688_00009779 [Phytophthora aleatoria]|uniref:WRKY19-like zinc finger domain-containing protein n=1 Tax=Phytophthora aleatoria TaxID=2496075 RepID=A0A8J5IWV3_9STRA|nr:hypothetical protein JG688_00009779 [Phytophthora aleatoria]
MYFGICSAKAPSGNGEMSSTDNSEATQRTATVRAASKSSHRCCSLPDCNKWAVLKGFCFAHGGYKFCTYLECEKKAKSEVSAGGMVVGNSVRTRDVADRHIFVEPMAEIARSKAASSRASHEAGASSMAEATDAPKMGVPSRRASRPNAVHRGKLRWTKCIEVTPILKSTE